MVTKPKSRVNLRGALILHGEVAHTAFTVRSEITARRGLLNESNPWFVLWSDAVDLCTRIEVAIIGYSNDKIAFRLDNLCRQVNDVHARLRALQDEDQPPEKAETK